MKIAVLSGKGGTGKTLVSVNLASVSEGSCYIDCDVEEPNGHLFFKPEKIEQEAITVKMPVVDQDRCTGCRACVDFCAFNALAYIKDQLLVFEEICHSCGGCVLVCPEDALSEKDKAIGSIERGISEDVFVHTGIMNTGEVSGIPIVDRLLEEIALESERDIFIDGPPGTACIVMETIKGADFCLLVAEPTLFGAHNLQMVHELVALMKKPFGVILNKCQEGENPSEIYAMEHGIPIIGRIPFDEKLGLINSNGEIVSRVDEGYRQLFASLLKATRKAAAV
jgi:MinD superfamily P-loop ATPase